MSNERERELLNLWFIAIDNQKVLLNQTKELASALAKAYATLRGEDEVWEVREIEDD